MRHPCSVFLWGMVWYWIGIGYSGMELFLTAIGRSVKKNFLYSLGLSPYDLSLRGFPDIFEDR